MYSHSLCLTFCGPMDCSPPGSSVHEIFQARILEWVVLSNSRGSSCPRDRTWSLASPAVAGDSLSQATWEALSIQFLGINPEKAMAPHSSTLTWKIPWTEEPGRLQSMRSLRVRHDWATSLSLFSFMHWRRKWQPTPLFLPGESQGQRSLVGGCLWGLTESDTTEAT